MSGITEEVLEQAETFLRSMGHTMTGIAHNGPGGDEARTLAAVTLELNLDASAETAQLIVDTLAFFHSSGRVCRHVLDAPRVER